MKVCEICGNEILTRDGENRCRHCEDYEDLPAESRAKRKRARRAKDEVMRSLGLVKVRGAMGGTYWE